MRNPTGEVVEQSQWIQQNVPGVPTQEAADVNPEPAQASGHQRKNPAHRAVPGPRGDPMDEVERKKPQAKSDKGEEKNKDEVRPEKAARNSLEMNKVSNDVGRVWKEDEPA